MRVNTSGCVPPLEVARRYFTAWNQHDASALAASFARDGSYRDLLGGQGLKGEALAAYARDLWANFPDLSFELLSAAETGPGVVAAEWRLHGTCAGRPIEVTGLDFIEVQGDQIRLVEAHHDPQVLSRQLGRETGSRL